MRKKKREKSIEVVISMGRQTVAMTHTNSFFCSVLTNAAQSLCMQISMDHVVLGRIFSAPCGGPT